MMKKYLLKLLTLFLIFYSLDSCNDPIFYTVTQETPLIPPKIDGSPSNFVILNDEMYVASGKNIFKYGKNEQSECKWSKMDLNGVKLGNYIVNLAATDNSLYAHYLNNDLGGIIRFNEIGNSSVDLEKPQYIQTIYASANILFICARKSVNTYTIYYMDEDDSSGNIKELEGITSMLNGVASDNKYYYLCTYSGIYYVEIGNIDSSSATLLKDEEDKAYTEFTGIINLNDNYVAAINKNGDLYEINDAAIVKKASFNDSRESTGALALWRKNGEATQPSLLLVGRSEYYYSTISRYTNGYVEIELDETTGRIKENINFREPGNKSPTTIDNYDRYVSSLGRKIIKHFIQTPSAIDEDMTLFASTHKNGVWSYRDHGDGENETWNAER
jgi:hypothetical protein